MSCSLPAWGQRGPFLDSLLGAMDLTTWCSGVPFLVEVSLRDRELGRRHVGPRCRFWSIQPLR